jgi:triosephosphate isomerase (TIM)
MRQRIVAGNWKMHGRLKELSQLTHILNDAIEKESPFPVVILPPALYIPKVSEIMTNPSLLLGAQNVYPAEAGPFTGEISAPMLSDFHCRYVLVGHSERRHLFHENENFVAQKFHHVKEHGMIPILCVGETLFDRENSLTEQVISKQLLAVAEQDSDCFSHCVVAYEPVWAIGTGMSASPEQAEAVHAFIRASIGSVNPEAAKRLPLLYGGSVNANNVSALCAMPNVDGVLVGGASLDAAQFLEIIQCINSYY